MDIKQKFEEAKIKHKALIDRAINLMSQIQDDPVHDIRHTEDVLDFAQQILEINDFGCNIEVVVVSVFWHDVGRIFVSYGHEQKSAEMLSEYFSETDYEKEFIQACVKAVGEHNYLNIPSTIEGKILRDADTLALLGKRRWQACLEENISLDLCIELLPDIQSKYLELEESRNLCAKAFSDVISILYEFLKKKS